MKEEGKPHSHSHPTKQQPSHSHSAKQQPLPSNPEQNSVISQNPYLPHIESLLEQEIELQLSNPQPTSNVLTSILGSQLKQFTSELKVQKLKMLRVREQQVYGNVIENCIHKIVQLNQKISKVKEFYIYCKHLKNGCNQLSNNIEKYFEYARKQPTIVQELQNYLNNPIISDIIFREYLKTYNVNIFTSDLIVHYFHLNVKGLLKRVETRLFEAQRIPQLVILQKENVVFKQLYDINLKYSELQDQMKHSYINNVISIIAQHQENSEKSMQRQPQKTNKKQDTFQEYNNTINQKLQNLNHLIGKMTIMGRNLVQNLQNSQLPVLVNEYQQNFDSLGRYLRFSQRGVVNKGQLHHGYKSFVGGLFECESKASERESLRAFFEKNMIFEQEHESSDKEHKCTQEKFEFLQEKIIKAETLLVLNKIFSTFNMFSYMLQQINPGACKQSQYKFSSLKSYINSEFRGDFIQQQSLYEESAQNLSKHSSKKSLKAHHHSPSHKAHFNVFIETDEFGNWMLLSGSQKLIYPSAVRALVEVLQFMVQVATLLQNKQLYSKELMLQLLSLKAQQISKIGEVLFNIFNLIKSKQVSCYALLNQYMQVALKAFFQSEIRWLQNLDLGKDEHDLFINELDFIEKNKLNNAKEGNEAQVEREYLEQRKRVADEMTHARVTKFLTFFAEKAKKADFLSQITYELDSNYEISSVLEQLVVCQQYHYKTFYFHDNSLFYETVLYEIIQMRNHIKLDHYFTLPRLHEAFGFFTVKALSFGDILNRLAFYSTKQLRIEELLMFFKTQLKLKRSVFRGELYWLSYKGSIGNGKEKSFKEFVEEAAKDILELSQEPLEYFLQNMQEFVKKVGLFEEQIERFRHLQTIRSKMNNCLVKVKNIDTHLSALSCKELREISTVICSFNPILKILKNQKIEQTLFADMSTSIQTSNRIKFEDLGRHMLMLEERQRLAEELFAMKCFGFELSYGDCFNLFVDANSKSYLAANDGLKLLMNRDRSMVIKHYEEVMLEDRKNMHLAIAFYRSLIIVALLSIKGDVLDEEDQAGLEELLKHVSYPLNIVSEIQAIKQIFSESQESDPSSQQLYRLLRIKAALKRIQAITSQTQIKTPCSSKDYSNHCVQTICLVAKLSLYAQKRIVQKLQQAHYDIIQKEKTDSKKVSRELHLLNSKILAYFMALMGKCQQEYAVQFATSLKSLGESAQNEQASYEQIAFDNMEFAMEQVEQQFQQKLAQLTSMKSTTFSTKKDLILFDTHCGYKVKQDPEDSAGTTHRAKQLLRRNDRKMIKKALFSPVRSTNAAQSNIMQNIQKRVGIEIIKESMGLRKVISKLQLQEKKMKDEIAWQTSKLEHNVIKKIHAFITESNMDQEQSYINFKYTVNLETIKGMQNVIREQTELAIKASEDTMRRQMQELKNEGQKAEKSPISSPKEQPEESQFFLTDPEPKPTSPPTSQQQSSLGYQNSRMLNTNIDSIFNHMRKIRVFAAWKRVNRNMDLTNQEWKNFNRNVANILHNQNNIKKIETIDQKRSECFKENILCSLLKEENSILSEKIRNAKVESLNKIVQEYKRKLISGEKS